MFVQQTRVLFGPTTYVTLQGHRHALGFQNNSGSSFRQQHTRLRLSHEKLCVLLVFLKKRWFSSINFTHILFPKRAPKLHRIAFYLHTHSILCVDSPTLYKTPKQLKWQSMQVCTTEIALHLCLKEAPRSLTGIKYRRHNWHQIP